MATITITNDLLKTAPFTWDISKQTPAPQRNIAIASDYFTAWGKVLLSASAAIRCGAQINLVGEMEQTDARELALAIPEAIFSDMLADSDAVRCVFQAQSEIPENAVAIVSEAPPKIPENSLAIIAPSAEESVLKDGTRVQIWPQIKVLLSDGKIYEPESPEDDDDEMPFVIGGEFVLLGICSAMLARGFSPEAAAVWGAHIYDLAVKAAAKDAGADSIRASFLVAQLSGSLRYATHTAKPKKVSHVGLRPQ